MRLKEWDSPDLSQVHSYGIIGGSKLGRACSVSQFFVFLPTLFDFLQFVRGGFLY